MEGVKHYLPVWRKELEKQAGQGSEGNMCMTDSARWIAEVG